MSYAEVLYTVPEELRRHFREYERIVKKLINLNWSIEFNSICKKENILPNYSRLRHHDPAVATTATTLKYRKYLTDREINNKKKKKVELEKSKKQCESKINNFACNTEAKDKVRNCLKGILENSDKVTKTRVSKKLNVLYQGQAKVCDDRGKSLLVKENVDSFINFSDYDLTDDEREFLNLGLNCHLEPKYSKLHKKVELEVLYQNLLDLESRNTVTVSPKLADQLRCESTKHRYKKRVPLLSPSLKTTANNLKNNEHIIIRKADKSNMYVILNKDEYLDKIDSILSDTSKFKLVTRNPTEQLKQRANKLIEALNAAHDDIKLSKIVGDYKPGYIYGNVKTHKIGNPLRPIISQIPVPTYNLAKKLNQIISPYIPDQFSLKSSTDFIDLLQTSKRDGIIASFLAPFLVWNFIKQVRRWYLFTNVPINDTIDIILHEAYIHLHTSSSTANG